MLTCPFCRGPLMHEQDRAIALCTKCCEVRTYQALGLMVVKSPTRHGVTTRVVSDESLRGAVSVPDNEAGAVSVSNG